MYSYTELYVKSVMYRACMAKTPEPTRQGARARLTREEQRAQTRDRLLDAAEELFVANGIGDTSIEQIAETAGYSRGAFYSNFDDKDALVLALIERHQDRSMVETDEIAEAATGPDDFLARLFERSLNMTQSRSTIGVEYTMYVPVYR